MLPPTDPPTWAWTLLTRSEAGFLWVCMLSRISCVQLFVTLWTSTYQAPPSMGFSRQEYWSGLPCPPPGDLPNPGIEATSLTSACIGRWILYCQCLLGSTFCGFSTVAKESMGCGCGWYSVGKSWAGSATQGSGWRGCSHLGLRSWLPCSFTAPVNGR